MSKRHKQIDHLRYKFRKILSSGKFKELEVIEKVVQLHQKLIERAVQLQEKLNENNVFFIDKELNQLIKLYAFAHLPFWFTVFIISVAITTAITIYDRSDCACVLRATHFLGIILSSGLSVASFFRVKYYLGMFFFQYV
jgi:hypothetical protein